MQDGSGWFFFPPLLFLRFFPSGSEDMKGGDQEVDQGVPVRLSSLLPSRFFPSQTARDESTSRVPPSLPPFLPMAFSLFLPPPVALGEGQLRDPPPPLFPPFPLASFRTGQDHRRCANGDGFFATFALPSAGLTGLRKGENL